MTNNETRKCRKLFLFTLFLIALYCCGIYVFVCGFMPYKSSKSIPASLDNLPPEPYTDENNFRVYKRRYRQVVFVLIDALRADFFSPRSNFFNVTPFVNVQKLLNDDHAVWFRSRAYSPTVTLPRVKSLLTGKLPGFADILTNFNAQELPDDNWLSQAKTLDLKLVFYGDDTWIKLFPPQFFQRYEGTHSFYVKDYTEVDNNVTRHLREELTQNDWDVMVLHYLGVDHIGHAHGPQSPILPKKLGEMDDIIWQILRGLQDGGSTNLVVVCGDHGMTSGGNHGGSSELEVLTPLIFVNTKRKKDSVLFGFPDDVSQVDVATTLSVLLGLPIPSDSMGIVIPDALSISGMTPREILYAAFYNFLQLGSVYRDAFSDNLLESSGFLEIVERHKTWLKSQLINSSKLTDVDYVYLLKMYMKHLHALQHELLHAAKYNDNLMIAGIVVTWVSFVFIFVLVLKMQTDELSIFPPYGIILIFCVTVMCSAIITLYNFLAALYVLVSCTTIPYVLWVTLVALSKATNQEKIHLFFMFLPILSLGSSSFIEEEHQTWYFLTTSCLWLSVWNIFYYRTDKIINYTIWHQVLDALQLLLLHRVFRSWNQTGNKWIHLPDIQDWITQDQNATLLHILVFISFSVLIVLLKNYQFIIVSSGFACSYINKYHNIFIQNISNSIQGPHIVYFHSFLLFVIAAYKYIANMFFSNHQTFMQNRKAFILGIVASCTLIATVVSRNYNIPLIAGTLLQERLLYKLSWQKCCSDFVNCTWYLIMAMSSFFYIGNSNSLSTIDVFAGYTGITTYQPAVVAFLLLCNTYSCYIIWLIMAFYRISCVSDSRADTNVNWRLSICCCGFLLYRMLMLVATAVLVYFQKHHLFIFSVFAPKLFYEISHTVLSILIWIVMICICCL